MVALQKDTQLENVAKQASNDMKQAAPTKIKKIKRASNMSTKESFLDAGSSATSKPFND